jgi:SLT domain-containing protein
MRSHSSVGMMAALALAAGAGHGNAVEVIDRRRNDSPPAAAAPRLIKRRGKRLETRTAGGNWQGQPYLSYAEHDRCTRAGLAEVDDTRPSNVRKLQRVAGYHRERAKIIASR